MDSCVDGLTSDHYELSIWKLDIKPYITQDNYVNNRKDVVILQDIIGGKTVKL